MAELGYISMNVPATVVDEPLDVFIQRACGIGLDHMLAVGMRDVVQVELTDQKALVSLSPQTSQAHLVQQIFQPAISRDFYPMGSLGDAFALQPASIEDPARRISTLVVSQQTVNVMAGACESRVVYRRPGQTSVDDGLFIYRDDQTNALVRNFSINPHEQNALKSMSGMPKKQELHLGHMALALMDDETTRRIKTGVREALSRSGTVPPAIPPTDQLHVFDKDMLGKDNGERLFSWAQWEHVLGELANKGATVASDGDIDALLKAAAAAHNIAEAKTSAAKADAYVAEWLTNHPDVARRLKTDSTFKESFVANNFAAVRSEFAKHSSPLPHYAGAFRLHELVGASRENDNVRLPVIVPNIELAKLHTYWQQDESFQLVAFDQASGLYASGVLSGDEGLVVTTLPSRTYSAYSWTRFDRLTRTAFFEMSDAAKRIGSISISQYN